MLSMEMFLFGDSENLEAEFIGLVEIFPEAILLADTISEQKQRFLVVQENKEETQRLICFAWDGENRKA